MRSAIFLVVFHVVALLVFFGAMDLHQAIWPNNKDAVPKIWIYGQAYVAAIFVTRDVFSGRKTKWAIPFAILVLSFVLSLLLCRTATLLGGDLFEVTACAMSIAFFFFAKLVGDWAYGAGNGPIPSFGSMKQEAATLES